MDSLRLKNVRSLADTGWVQLSPVTLLVGENSSGKSSLLRFLPLLRQSVEAPTTGPFLWYGNYVDFGTFDEVLRKSPDAEELEFWTRFRIDSPRLRHRGQYGLRRRLARQGEFGPYEVELGLAVKQQTQKEAASLPASLDITFADHNIHFEYGASGQVEVFQVNDLIVQMRADEVMYETVQGAGLIPLLIRREGPDERSSGTSLSRHLGYRGDTALWRGVLTALRPLFHGNTQDSTIMGIARRLELGSSKDILAQLKSIRAGGGRFQQRVARLSVDSRSFRRICDRFVAAQTATLLELIDMYLTESASNVSYIAPVRASIERFYRIQGLAVREVDYEGRNLAMFLRGLTDTERRSFQDWVSEALGFTVSARMSSGHIYLTLTEEESENEYNIADVGFGISQVLPVLAQLWVLIRRKSRQLRGSGVPAIFAVEQPELHLHPRMQAQLADIFLRAVQVAKENGLDLRIVIETHSEAIVNRIGGRIGDQEIDPQLIKVVLFERREGVSLVKFSEYDDEGYLTDWPYGFFDSVITPK